VNSSWRAVCGSGETLVSCGSLNYTNNYNLLQINNTFLSPVYYSGPNTHAWWVDGGNKTATVGITLVLVNGNYVTIPAMGKFNMYRPTVTLEPLEPLYQQRYFTINSPNPLWCTLKLGDNDESGNGTMRFILNVWSTFQGSVGITQLIKADYSNPTYQFEEERCDGSEYYDDQKTIVLGNRVNPYTGNPIPNAILPLTDGPHNKWSTPNRIQLSARDFVRFTPNDGIPVTLSIVRWGIVGIAEYSLLDTDWHLTTNAITGPSEPDGSDNFPIWTSTR
jgi:hypothetical protein